MRYGFGCVFVNLSSGGSTYRIRSCMKKTKNPSVHRIMAEDKRITAIEAEARSFFNTASYLQRSLGCWFKSSW